MRTRWLIANEPAHARVGIFESSWFRESLIFF